MADVLIVCVREDEPRAKALAEMFEAAGFSIGGAPGSDGALRSSGAGLVVWSQASIRSRPFLDAAQRVINAEKAVVASLIEPPPPSSIGDSPVFDLSRWDGDPNDPSLDPLFFAVDRMVNSARAGVGASTQTESRGYDAPSPAYEAPPPRPSRPAPPPAPQANFARSASPGDPLGGEAEHWRAIRDSRNPSDFMDYLARYGAEGAFAEVAELRLKQLTQGNVNDAARASGAPAARSPAPSTSRPTLPSRPLESTRRLDAPPMRRAEPPPLRRPPTDRGFDRNELREPPRAEGGGSPMRAFILIALLGGAALAGGLYFGGGIPNFASAPEQTDVADVSPSAPGDEPTDVLDEPVGVPLEDTTAPVIADRRADQRREEARREEARRDEARREPAPTPTRPRETETPPPAPTTSWAANNANAGPTSLSPGSSPATNATPPAPVPLSPSVTAAATPSSRGSTRPAGNVVWASRPTARRVADLYPERASREGVGGRVELDCSVRSNQSLACSVANESPAGLGFGRAALNAAGSYRAQPWLSDGTDSTGTRTRVVFQFNAPEQ